MLAKEKSAVPLGLTEPFAAVEWKIIEVGILVVLIYASEGKAILPPVAYVDWGCEHQAYLVYMVEVDMLVFHLLLLVALVRKLTKFIFRVVEAITRPQPLAYLHSAQQIRGKSLLQQLER